MAQRPLSARAPAAGTANGGVNPMIRRLGLQELVKRDETAEPPEPIEIDDVHDNQLAGHVRMAWQQNKIYKQRIDLKLLKCLRARRGVYSPQEINDIQQSNGGINIVWAPLTEVKSRAGSAWTRDVVLPVGEQPWGLESTPVPDLPLPMKQAIVKKAVAQAQQIMQQAAQAGGGVPDPDEFRDMVWQVGDKLRGEAEKTYKKLADDRVKRMEKKIADRLVEGNYYHAMDAFIEDFTTFPAAILKGPVYKRHKRLEWGPGWKPKVVNTPVQWWERVSPFDIYPGPGANNPQKGNFIERIRFQRSDLADLKGLPGYRDDQLDGALKDYSNGHLEGWLWTEGERQRLEQETMYLFLSPPGIIDALNFWGRVPGWKLLSWGVEGIDTQDTTREYECNVVVCGSYVLYASLNPHPLGRRPYHKACYDEIAGAFWGRSVPDLCETPQKMCNGIACATADNLSIASGPMSWVHVDRLADGEQSLEMFPWKQFQLRSDPTQGVNPGIGFFQPDDRSANHMDLYEKWEIRADDATGIPRYTYGNERAGGSADTATGLQILMSNAAKGLRRGISNIDGNVIEQTIYDAFINEMLYNPDESIKGDCQIVPRGAAMILIRESAQQRRIQFLTMTANPIDAAILTAKYRAALLRETAAAMELPVDDIVPSDDEIDQQQQQQQQMAAAQQQALVQAEQAKQTTELQIQNQKDQAQMQRDQNIQDANLMGSVVKAAVQEAFSKDRENAKVGNPVDKNSIAALTPAET